MASSPKLKPNLLILNASHEKRFESSSALVLNSLFRHYNPSLASLVKDFDLTAGPGKTLQPEIKNNPERSMEPDRQFNTPDMGGRAEAIGDGLSALASGTLFDDAISDAISSEGLIKGTRQELRHNPALLFSTNKKLTPKSSNNRQKDLDLEAESKKREEAKLKRRNSFKLSR